MIKRFFGVLMLGAILVSGITVLARNTNNGTTSKSATTGMSAGGHKHRHHRHSRHRRYHRRGKRY